jgi:hypothetical protein
MSKAPQTMELNPRGIPRAPFVVSTVSADDKPDIEKRSHSSASQLFGSHVVLRCLHAHQACPAHTQDNVEEYVGGKDAEIEGVIKKFQETSACVQHVFPQLT